MENLHYVEEKGARFFATGGSQMECGLDLKYLPLAQGKGINLSSNGQTLQQSYETAKHVFEHVKPDTVKFVLIDLSASDNFLTVESVKDISKPLEDYFKLCFDNGARPVGVILPAEQTLKKTFDAAAFKAFSDTVELVGKKYNLLLTLFHLYLDM